MLILVCREVLLIIPAFQLGGTQGGRRDLSTGQNRGLGLGEARFIIGCPPVPSNEQLSIRDRDREKGEANSHRSKKKGR